MQLEGLTILLGAIDAEIEQARRQVASDIAAATKASNQINELESRVQSLVRELPIEQPQTNTEESVLEPGDSIAKERNSSLDWNKLVSEARGRLVGRGVDVEQLSVDDLIDADELRQIEHRFSGDFKLAVDLDAYDVCASVFAGLAAGVIDFLIVRIPADVKYLGEFVQRGSPLTKWMHSLNVPADNWLAKYCKTSYDKVSDVADRISGFNPRTHRLQTFGHDPLIGLVIGTIDIMRGGLTAIDKEGHVVSISDQAAGEYNPLIAFTRQILHLISDGFTKMGLPAPGWSLLQMLQVGSFGDRERTIAELARWMYLKGYDSRHFLTMTTSVAAAESILRTYFWIRRRLDKDYAAEMSYAAQAACVTSTSQHPRFQGMALASHSIAAAINAGKVAIYGGNPLAINYAQWLRLLHASFKVLQTRMRSPTDVLVGHGRAGLKALDEGWPTLNNEDMPTLIARS